MRKALLLTLSSFVILLASSKLSFGETTMSQEGQYIFNSLGFFQFYF